MSKLGELAAKRDQVLLAEIGALIHDLGKLSREFIAQPSDAHSHILGRTIGGSDPYHTDDTDKVCAYFSIIDFHLKYDEGVKQRLSGSQMQEIAALTDEAQVDWRNHGGNLDEVHHSLQEKLSKSSQLEPITEPVLKFLEDYRQEVIDIPNKIRKAENSLAGIVNSAVIEVLEESAFEAVLLSTEPAVARQTKRLGDFIALHHQTPVCPCPALVALLRAGDGGADGFDSWLDKGQVSEEAKQPASHTFIATAFGHEPECQRIALDALTDVRERYADALTDALQQIKQNGGKLPEDGWLELLCAPRTGLRARTEAAFRHALGETRRAANEVTLWDHSYSAASLYKAALSKVILEGKWTEPVHIKWRILRVSFDGLGFWGQAHHVTDLLGRQRAVEEALDKVREELEIAHPLGNEIYRDENGSAFLMPDLGKSHHEVEAAVRKIVGDAMISTDLAGELLPECYWYPQPVREEMARAFGTALREAPRPLAGDPHRMDGWWKDFPHHEICTVCGMRPVGYKPEDAQTDDWVKPDKAEKRHVCCVCLNRRGRRAEIWLTKKPHLTIWADEVVDVNGRFALVVGRFDLGQWLDGTLVRTMLTAFNPKEKEPEKRFVQKNPSPARVRRVWETTRHFWETVQKEEIPELVGEQRPRLAITPRHKERLVERKEGLGGYHTYELDVNGFFIGVVWDPVGQELILTEYLRDLARRLGLPKESWADETRAAEKIKSWLEDRAPGRPWRLLEPSGHLAPAAETGHDIEVECVHGDVSRYTPHIPLLIKPALFMALVPAGNAMDVVSAIKEKYEREMSKVRDRLPLQLGVVFAPRRTPLRAVLEAGRAMLERGGRDRKPGTGNREKWTVAEKPRLRKAHEAPEYLTVGNHHFERWWDVPLTKDGREIHLRIGALMGDGETPDQWYPYLLNRRLGSGEEPNAATDLTRAGDLVEGQMVYVAPSTFDFEFLDTTARRFEIHYDDNGRRSRPTRPFLLDEIADLHRVWDLISKRLTTSQWMALNGLIEQKRQEWNEPWGASEEQYSGAFKQFVHDALRTTEWIWKADGKDKKGWRNLDRKEQDLLRHAALQGMLNDTINLYHEIMKEK